MNPIPQVPEDLAFGREDLRAGCQDGIYEAVTTREAERIRSTGAMISSSFVVWQDGPEGRKGRFVVNLSKQSKHWHKGSVRMETLPEYALELEHGERMVSFDIQAGYRHFRLAQQMRDWFLFRNDGRFYRCISLPIERGRSPMWLTQLMVPMVRKSKATVSSSRVLVRLPGMPCQGREGSQHEGLPGGGTGDRQATFNIRYDTASDEGGMGRDYSGGTPWLRDRLRSHAFLHSAAKNSQGTWYREGYPPARTARAAVGFDGQVTIVLWCVRIIVDRNALCSLLNQEVIRRHDQKAQRRTSIKEWESLPVES
jgi:hypothetical protein